MVRHCAVVGCNTNSRKHPDSKFFKFPGRHRKAELRAIWEHNVNRTVRRDGTPWFAKKYESVCYKHFVEGAPTQEYPVPQINMGHDNVHKIHVAPTSSANLEGHRKHDTNGQIEDASQDIKPELKEVKMESDVESSEVNTMSCPQCDFSTLNMMEYIQHLEAHCRNIITENAKGTRWYCETCGLEFDSVLKHDIHSSTCIPADMEHKPKVIQESSNASQGSLVQHHTSPVEGKDEITVLPPSNSSVLAAVSRVGYKCKVCDYKTSNGEEYETHLRMHNSQATINIPPNYNVPSTKVSKNQKTLLKRKSGGRASVKSKPQIKVTDEMSVLLSAIPPGQKYRILSPTEVRKYNLVEITGTGKEPRVIAVLKSAQETLNDQVVASEDETEQGHQSLLTNKKDTESDEMPFNGELKKKNIKQIESVAPHVPYMCNICREPFKNLESYKIHMTKAHVIEACHKSLRHECNECKARFKRMLELIGHIKLVHQQESTIVCSHCGQIFADTKMMEQHVKVHLSEKNFSCHRCKQTFENTAELAIHLKQDHSSLKKQLRNDFDMSENLTQHLNELKKCTSPRECQFCFDVFISVNCLERHIRKHRDVYRCDECGLEFDSSLNLNVHMEIENHIGTSYLCVGCKKVFKMIKRFQKHQMKCMAQCDSIEQNEDPNKNVGDSEASNTQTREGDRTTTENNTLAESPEDFDKEDDTLVSSLSDHKSVEITNSKSVLEDVAKQKATGEDSQNNEVNINECNQCSRKFSTLEALTSHMESMACHKDDVLADHFYSHLIEAKQGPTMYNCKICGKDLGSLTSLRDHYLRHEGRRPYKCDRCEKCFTNRGGLYRHTTTHTGEKKHQCDTCGKRFYDKRVLSQHKLVHTKVRAHECDICHRRFRLDQELRQHKRKEHENERSKVCEYCGKSFFHLQQLKEHVRVHTGEKPFSCQFCPKAFRTKEQRKMHERVHTGDKPFICTICGYACTQKSALNAHKKKHEKGMNKNVNNAPSTNNQTSQSHASLEQSNTSKADNSSGSLPSSSFSRTGLDTVIDNLSGLGSSRIVMTQQPQMDFSSSIPVNPQLWYS